MGFLYARNDARRRLDDPTLEQSFIGNAGPAVEQLQHLGPRLDLAAQIGNQGLLQNRHQGLEIIRLPIGHTLQLAAVDTASPLDHVERQGPGGAGKADQRRLVRQFTAQSGQGFEHRRQVVKHATRLQGRNSRPVGDRIQQRADPFLKPDVLAQRIRDHQDIGKHDRRVEAITPDRL